MNDIHSGIQPEYAHRIEAFRLFDDTFLSTVFDNKPKPTERLLRIILDRNDIEVLDVKAQYRIPNLVDHDIVLDILAQDTGGKKYDIEVQRNRAGAPPQRARYNLALMDARSLEKGESYTSLKENYVIFITEENLTGRDEPVSRIERYFAGTNDLFGDGSHIVYVNGAYQPKENEDSDLIRLIHDFHCTDPGEFKIPEIAEQIYFYKRTEGGRKALCKIMEEFIEEEREALQIRNIQNLMKNLNLTAEQAMDALSIPPEEREKLTEKL